MRESNATLGQRLSGAGLAVLTALVLVFLVAPILIIVPLSFSAGSFFHYPLPGLQPALVRGFLRLELLAAIGLEQPHRRVGGDVARDGAGHARRPRPVASPLPGQGLLLALLISPMVVPVIIIAVGVYFAFAPLGLTDGYAGLILAHTTLAVPFVVITVLATLSGFDRTLLRAAASLGAPPLTAFRRVTLPLILPGVASGAVFAFAASFDEVVVALLIAGPGQRTLPRQMFAGINDNISLTITAAATMLIAISLTFMVFVSWLQRRSHRLGKAG